MRGSITCIHGTSWWEFVSFLKGCPLKRLIDVKKMLQYETVKLQSCHSQWILTAQLNLDFENKSGKLSRLNNVWTCVRVYMVNEKKNFSSWVIQSNEPQPGSVVVEHWPGMLEVGGSISVWYSAALLSIQHIVLSWKPTGDLGVRTVVWAGTSLPACGMVFHWASTTNIIKTGRRSD